MPSPSRPPPGCSQPIPPAGIGAGHRGRRTPLDAYPSGGAGDGYVTVIVDLTPVFDGVGPARLLDLVPGRSSAVLTTWLDERGADFRGRIEVVAMVPRERGAPTIRRLQDRRDQHRSKMR